MPDKLLAKAEALRGRSRFREGLLLYKKALKKYRAVNDREGVVNCLLALGDTYRMTGDFVVAGDAYGEAMRLTPRNDAGFLRADALVGLGLSKRALGDWRGSLKLFSQARDFYKKRADTNGTAFCLWAEGGALRVGGKIREAIVTFRKAKRLFELLPPEDGSSGIAYCLCSLGGASRVAGLFDTSLEYYREAQHTLSMARDRFGTAYAHCGIGNAWRMKGDYRRALVHLVKASSLYERIGDIVSSAYTLWSIGMTHLMTGNLSKAERSFRDAQKKFMKTKDVRGLIYAKLGLSELLVLRNNKRRALRLLKAAIEDSRKNRFAVELCHSLMLMHCIKQKQQNNSCYRKAGLRLHGDTIPLNIP